MGQEIFIHEANKLQLIIQNQSFEIFNWLKYLIYYF